MFYFEEINIHITLHINHEEVVVVDQYDLDVDDKFWKEETLTLSMYVWN